MENVSLGVTHSFFSTTLGLVTSGRRTTGVLGMTTGWDCDVQSQESHVATSHVVESILDDSKTKQIPSWRYS